MARTIKLRESDLTKIIKSISESQLLMEKPRSWKMDWDQLKSDIKNLISWFNIGSTIWGWFGSDSRLKKNIRRVGKSPSGIPIYEFEYKNKVRFGGGTYRGVIAEHAPKKAVKTHSNGYKMVDYSKIDVAFERVNPTKRKTIKLKESDLSNIIKRVISEKDIKDPGSTIFYPDNPFERGMSKDPMALGNEEMETRSDMDASSPKNHPRFEEFMILGTNGSRALRMVAQEGGALIADEITMLADSIDEILANPDSITREDIEQLGPQIQKIWKWLVNRYKKCACGTSPETYDQSCCKKG